MESGYIGLFRKIISSWIFKNPIILQVFIYFLCKAATKCCKVEANGQTISLIPGQLVSGRKHLMQTLNLTERQARRALEQLTNNKVIEVKTSSTISVVTVKKYNEYQSHVKSLSVQHNKEIEQVLITKPKRDLLFDKFWDAYPKKRSKAQATRVWNRIRPTHEKAAEIMKGLKAAKQSEDWIKQGGKYIPHPSTWLNAEGWLDEYEIKGIGSTSQKKTLPTAL